MGLTEMENQSTSIYFGAGEDRIDTHNLSLEEKIVANR